jgi:hypothetical protein
MPASAASGVKWKRMGTHVVPALEASGQDVRTQTTAKEVDDQEGGKRPAKKVLLAAINAAAASALHVGGDYALKVR